MNTVIWCGLYFYRYQQIKDLRPGGKNPKMLKNVVEDDIVMQVNVDGVQGEESLRKYSY